MRKIRQFFKDFGAFISRGNILDLAIGVIIGSAFSAIISALVKSILMPVITLAIPGGLDGLVTVLNASASSVDPGNIPGGTNTVIYWGQMYNADTVNVINWGAFLNALIDFIIIGFVLFAFLRMAMSFSSAADSQREIKHAFTKEEIKALRHEGKSFLEIRKLASEKVAKGKEEKKKAEEEAKAKEETELSVLKEIRGLLSKDEKAGSK